MSDQDQLAAGACDRDIQTPVVEYKTCAARPDERKDHDIAFATLESLHGIHGNAGAVQHLA